MTTKSHYRFGLSLADRMGESLPLWGRLPFLFGCIEPDINLTTYLQGSLHGEKLKGHSYPNFLPELRTLFRKVSNAGTASPLFFYRLGKLTHYLTDAFTAPHNPIFPGNLKEHIAYENRLEKRFLKELQAGEKIGRNASVRCGDFLIRHENYLRLPWGEENDIRFTLALIPPLVAALAESALAAQEERKKKPVKGH